MLYPLSYEGITGFSSPCLRCQHNVSTTFRKLLVTVLDHSPLFKHVNSSGEYRLCQSDPSTTEGGSIRFRSVRRKDPRISLGARGSEYS